MQLDARGSSVSAFLPNGTLGPGNDPGVWGAASWEEFISVRQGVGVQGIVMHRRFVSTCGVFSSRGCVLKHVLAGVVFFKFVESAFLFHCGGVKPNQSFCWVVVCASFGCW